MTEQTCENCGHDKKRHVFHTISRKYRDCLADNECPTCGTLEACPCKKFTPKTGKYGDKGRPKNHSPQINGGNSLFTPEDTPSDNSGEPINSSEPEGTQNQEKEK